jgi:rubredoxin-NAD+ reductase
LTHTEVRAIDRATRTLTLADGRQVAFSQLVLAVGARPIRLPLSGSGADAVMSVNNLEDYARFEAAIAGKNTLAILGAGLIGCEFANDLIQSGRAVSVFDLASQPLGRLLPRQAAQFLRDRLAAAGVRFYFEDPVEAVEHTAEGFTLTTRSGAQVASDAVLSAVGLAPDLRLAAEAGLSVGRGIQVDDRLQTSDADIFALGDCAEVAGQVLPYVMPIMHGARVLAARLCGDDQRLAYPPMPVQVKTSLCPAVVCPPPPGGEWVETVTENGVSARHLNTAGALDGFALVGAATSERMARVKEMQG